MGSIVLPARGMPTATVTLSAAQLLALSVAPVNLIPAAAVGAGNYISPIAYALEYLFGTVPYFTPLPTNNCFFNYTGQVINSVNAPIAVTAWGTFIKLLASSMLTGPAGNAAFVGGSMAAIRGQGMNFGVPNALTLGNGTLRVTLMYLIFPA